MQHIVMWKVFVGRRESSRIRILEVLPIQQREIGERRLSMTAGKSDPSCIATTETILPDTRKLDSNRAN